MPGGVSFTTAGVFAAIGVGGVTATEMAGLGERLGEGSAATVLGVFTLLLVYGMVRMGQAFLRVMESTIEKNTQASQRMSDSAEHMSRVLVETKDAIRQCPHVKG